MKQNKEHTIDLIGLFFCVVGLCLVSGFVGYRIGVDVMSQKCEESIAANDEAHAEELASWMDNYHDLLHELEELKGIENPIDYE